MDAWVGAAVRVAEPGPPAEPDWFVMAAGMLIGAAVFYGLYRLGPKPQVSPSAGIQSGTAVLSAAGSLVFLVVGVVNVASGAT